MTTALLDPPLPPEDVDDPPGPDPDAPYGRNAKGEPYKRPAETRAKLAAALNGARAAKGAGKAPPRNRRPNGASGTRTAGKPASVDYRAAALGLLAIPQMGLALAGRLTGDQAYMLDAATLQIHGPAIAEVLDDAARESETIAGLLERAMMVGPYGKALTVAFAVGAQLAANHRLIAPNPEMGILDADGLAEALNVQAGK